MKEGESYNTQAFESGDISDSKDPHAKETNEALARSLREAGDKLKNPNKTLGPDDLSMSDYEYRLEGDRIKARDKSETKKRRKEKREAKRNAVPEQTSAPVDAKRESEEQTPPDDTEVEITPGVWVPVSRFREDMPKGEMTPYDPSNNPEGALDVRRISGRKKRAWEDIPEEERRRVYGESYEKRKLIYDLQKSRAVLALTEREVIATTSGEIKRGRALARSEGSESMPKASAEEEAYAEALKAYNEKRAEYMGESGLRYVKERVRMADAKAEHFYEGKWGRFRKGWSNLSTKWNLESARERRGEPSTHWLKRMGRRMMNVRTGIGVGLLAGAHLIPGVGGIAFGMRSAMAGVGSTMTSYDMMRRHSDKKELERITFDTETIPAMSTIEIESALDKYEAQAFFAGKRFPDNETYNTLIAEYKQRAKADSGAVEKVKELDKNIYQQESRLSREESVRQTKAVVLGVFGAVGIRWTAPLVQEYGREALHKITAGIQHGISALEQADPSGVIESFGGSKAIEKILTHTPFASPEDIDAHIQEMRKVSREALTQATEHTAVIEKGGSVFKSLDRMLKTGEITQGQYKEIVENSYYQSPGGNRIPIHRLDYVQPGLTMHVIEAHNGIPTHVEFGGNVGHIGDTNDLAHAFHSQGKPLPHWLEEKMGIDKAVESGVTTHHTLPIEHTPSPSQTHASIIRAHEAARGLSTGEFHTVQGTHRFSFGNEIYVVDKNNRLIAIQPRFFGGARHTYEHTQRAVRDLFHSDYEARIARSIPYYYDDPIEHHEEFLRRSYQAKEAANELAYMKESLRYQDGPVDRAGFILEGVEQLARVLRPMNVLKPDAMQF